MTTTILLSLMAVAYNNGVNYWRPFHSWAYVPANLTLAAVITATAIGPLGLGRTQLGVHGDLTDVLVVAPSYSPSRSWSWASPAPDMPP